MFSLVLSLAFNSLIASSINVQDVAASEYDIDYSDKDARLLVRLSASAYAADPRICIKKLLPANESWTVINAKEVTCLAEDHVCAVVVMISHIKKEIIIAYRGDFGDKQFRQEVEQWMGPDVNWNNYGNVGQLFISALNKTWVAVQPTLLNPPTSDYKITFTGYSLGGAIAALSAMLTFEEKLRSPEKIRVITFGGPRFADETFVDNYDRVIQNSYRVIHKADIIPHLIACRNESTFICDDSNAERRRSHHATEVWYNNNMADDSGFVICSKEAEDPVCSDSLKGHYNSEDHKYYFGLMVSDYGLNDCKETRSSAATQPSYSIHYSLTIAAIISVIMKNVFNSL